MPKETLSPTTTIEQSLAETNSTVADLSVDLHHLTLQSTLADLPNHDFKVQPNTLGQVIADEFAQRPLLPGVIVINKQTQILGAFSRRQFLERVGRQYGVEVYLKRPVHVMVESVGGRFMTLPSHETIQKAAQTVLKRPQTLFEEPLIVWFPDGEVRLINTYLLILAQSHLLELAMSVEQDRRQLAESLERIGRELSSSLSLKKVTKRILKELNKVVPFERGMVMLQEDEFLKVIAKRGFPAQITRSDLNIPIRPEDNDIYRRIVSSNEPLHIDDVATSDNWSQLESLPINHSWLGVPLVVQERVIGMLSLTRAERAQFDAYDETLAMAFASQAAVALENARLYGEITQFNEQLEAMVQERTIELDQANAILAKLDQTKSDFINVAAHELRTPLTVISGYTQIIKTLPPIKNDASVANMVESIIGGVDRLHLIVNSMLDIARIDSNTLTVRPENVDLQRLFLDVYQKLEGDCQKRQIRVDVSQLPELPEVYADPDLLAKVFDGLLINAIKYTPDGGTINVSGQQVIVDDRPFVEIALQDTGIGIAAENIELIFEKFFQTGEIAFHSSGRTKFKGGGPGLGLAIARGIIAAHGGNIWAESAGHDEENHPGSTFYVQLPLSVIIS